MRSYNKVRFQSLGPDRKRTCTPLTNIDRTDPSGRDIPKEPETTRERNPRISRVSSSCVSRMAFFGGSGAWEGNGTKRETEGDPHVIPLTPPAVPPMMVPGKTVGGSLMSRSRAVALLAVAVLWSPASVRPADDDKPKTVVYDVSDLIHRPGGRTGFDHVAEVARHIVTAVHPRSEEHT